MLATFRVRNIRTFAPLYSIGSYASPIGQSHRQRVRATLVAQARMRARSRFIARTLRWRRGPRLREKPSGHPAPVLSSPEHDHDPIAAFVAALGIFDGLAARRPPWDAQLYPFVFRCISEPVRSVAAVTQNLPEAGSPAGKQGQCSRSHGPRLEVNRPPFNFGNGVEFGTNPAPRLGRSDGPVGRQTTLFSPQHATALRKEGP